MDPETEATLRSASQLFQPASGPKPTKPDLKDKALGDSLETLKPHPPVAAC